MKMYELFLTCPKGLEEVCKKDLKDFSGKILVMWTAFTSVAPFTSTSLRRLLMGNLMNSTLKRTIAGQR